ncbi:MAG: hypothetical protein QW175_00925 [Candidatus Bathyarchaeia archaeon]
MLDKSKIEEICNHINDPIPPSMFKSYIDLLVKKGYFCKKGNVIEPTGKFLDTFEYLMEKTMDIMVQYQEKSFQIFLIVSSLMFALVVTDNPADAGRITRIIFCFVTQNTKSFMPELERIYQQEVERMGGYA